MIRLPWIARATLLAAACLSCRQPTDLPRDFDRRVAAPEAARAGRPLFMQYCALCHGERGNGRGVRASAFTTPPRDFTNEAWRASTSPRRVYRAVRDGLRGTPMPSWRALGEEADIDLTAYVLSIKP